MKKIYSSLRKVEEQVAKVHPQGLYQMQLPSEITFVHSEELEARYPRLTPKEREVEITR